MTPVAPKLPRGLLAEAYAASGEKRYALARIFYRVLFGSDWKWAVLGFAYLKCLDDAVDEQPDSGEALSVLKAQRELMERIYAGAPPDPGPAPPERYGALLFAHDRGRGSRIRPWLETIVDTMEFDVRRRGRVLPRAELDRNVLEAGGAVIRYLAEFVPGDAEPPDAFLELASRAYVEADALIDLKHDLRFGVINVPAEDMRSYGIDPERMDRGVRPWLAERAHAVGEHFDAALAEARQLSSRTLRLLAFLYLGNKRRQLRRFLEKRKIAVAP